MNYVKCYWNTNQPILTILIHYCFQRRQNCWRFCRRWREVRLFTITVITHLRQSWKLTVPVSRNFQSTAKNNCCPLSDLKSWTSLEQDPVKNDTSIGLTSRQRYLCCIHRVKVKKGKIGLGFYVANKSNVHKMHVYVFLSKTYNSILSFRNKIWMRINVIWLKETMRV